MVIYICLSIELVCRCNIKLALVERCIETIGGQQLLMFTLLHNVAIVYYENQIRIAYRQ